MPTPVEAALRACDDNRGTTTPRVVLDHIDHFFDMYSSYLRWAIHLGLSDEAAVNACVDLAETRAVMSGDPFYAAIHAEKLKAWNDTREAALATDRPPRVIDMELDPIFFAAMLDGSKTIEGRAYDPNSDKNYADIRAGDSARYRLSQRRPEFASQLGTLGLRPGWVMVRPIDQEHFAPSVASMYEDVGQLGERFQPTLPGVYSTLARIAVYHGFPNYNARITEHGFLGLEHPPNQVEIRE
jgi:hypothetical protein